MGARDTALSVLIACRRNGAWSDGALKQQISREKLSRVDAALATRLCFGVLQNRMLLDYWLEPFLRGKVEPAVRDILRLAVYQLHFLDKIPENAIVNEAVEQTKRLANPKAAGLVNAVLRNMLRRREMLTLPEDLSIRYSHPSDLVALLRENVGEDALESLLASHNGTPQTFVQVNTTVTTFEDTLRSLTDEGYHAQPHDWLEGCILLTGGSIEQSSAYQNGWIYAQDPAAKLAVMAAGLQPDMRVLDCCAAPGGKSFAAAICMGNRGVLLSCDLHAHKIELMQKGAARLRLSCMEALQQDARSLREDWRDGFDAVLADVPCSGLGVIRKKPDIRYKDLAPLSGLPAIQAAILDTQASYVKPGGILLYSTCTVLKRENEAVVTEFLERHSDYTAEAFSLTHGIQAPQGFVTLLPSTHGTDGFFICKLRRR